MFQHFCFFSDKEGKGRNKSKRVIMWEFGQELSVHCCLDSSSARGGIVYNGITMYIVLGVTNSKKEFMYRKHPGPSALVCIKVIHSISANWVC